MTLLSKKLNDEIDYENQLSDEDEERMLAITICARVQTYPPPSNLDRFVTFRKGYTSSHLFKLHVGLRVWMRHHRAACKRQCTYNKCLWYSPS